MFFKIRRTRYFVHLILLMCFACQPVIYAAQESYISNKKKQQQQQNASGIAEKIFPFWTMIPLLCLFPYSGNKSVECVRNTLVTVWTVSACALVVLHVTACAVSGYHQRQQNEREKREREKREKVKLLTPAQ